ncbi:hypothetical protein [Kitasatospora sp. NBC_01300]|uniref:hypothetical protein n=1 Tax=Kitasatospora sp. NBC_01300 TaxID=2903574 RepID=UPI002F916491|nr:hypothetical protein OG556_40700 [Kitasatospora sp. NBC_01300]
MNNVMLAGAVQNFGNSWARTLLDWVASGLMIALTAIVIVHAIRKMSIKAAIGGAIGLVICWSLFTGRYSISMLFENEYSENRPVTTAPIQGAGELQRELPVALTGQPGRS